MQDLKVTRRRRRSGVRSAGVIAAVGMLVAAACSEDRDPSTFPGAEPAPIEAPAATAAITSPPTTQAPQTTPTAAAPTTEQTEETDATETTAAATTESPDGTDAPAGTENDTAGDDDGREAAGIDAEPETADPAATAAATDTADTADTAATGDTADTTDATTATGDAVTADTGQAAAEATPERTAPAAQAETTPAETTPPETTTSATSAEDDTIEILRPETAPPAGSGPTFGNMPWPCGPAESPNTDDGSVPGVTAEQILIGAGDDAGFEVVPGLNHEATDAINAMAARCNELGGINGREVVVNYYDARLLNVNEAALRACGDGVFFLVGTAWAFDEQMEEIRQGCLGGVPTVPTFTVSGVSSHAPLMYQGNPNPADEQPAGGFVLLAEQFPEQVQSAGALSANIAAATSTRDKAIAISEPFGWNWVSTNITTNPFGEDDWTPFVNQLRSDGIEVIYFAGQCFDMLGLFAEAAAVNDYQPIIFGAPNMYEPRCAEAFPGTLDNLYFETVFVPMEEAEHNKATQDYLDAVAATGGDTALLGMQATSSFLLWAQAADACGATLTRDCVLDNLANTHEWTAGGLHAPSDPGGNHPATCTALFKFSGDTFARVAPAEPATWECSRGGSPPYLQPVDLAAVDELQLDENRVSRVFRNDDDDG